MLVTINGEARELPPGVTIQGMLAHFKLDKKILVVELNRIIVDRSAYENAVLKEGDQVEIVHFVGGG
jgi:thiamine biosynthesis protein ThiS